MTKIQDTPKNKCSICEQLQFEKNMNYITQELESQYENLLQNDKEIMNKKICKSCKKEIQNGKLPQFAVSEQIRCNTPLHTVETLSELEERLVSLRIAFAQIRKWGYKRSQMGLVGSIINVHVHMDVIQRELPQFVNETMTIAIALKR